MNENVIFAINYGLYHIGSMGCPVLELNVLKPRRCNMLIMYIYVATYWLVTTVKFLTPLYGGEQNMLSVVVNVMYVIYLKMRYEDKFVKCIFVHAMFLMVCVASSMTWNFMPNPASTNYEVDTIIGYMCSNPVMYASLFILSKIINVMQKKNVRMVYAVAVLAGAFAFYNMFVSYILVTAGVYPFDSLSYVLPFIIILAAMFVTMSVTIEFAYAKNSEVELKSHLTRLETARSLEEESYRRTLERIEAMAKLRHDFYGQLQAARYLLETDPEEGRKMLEDMRKQVGTYE